MVFLSLFTTSCHWSCYHYYYYHFYYYYYYYYYHYGLVIIVHHLISLVQDPLEGGLEDAGDEDSDG